MLKKIVIAFGLLISAFVLVVGGLYVKGGQAEILLWWSKSSSEKSMRLTGK